MTYSDMAVIFYVLVAAFMFWLQDREIEKLKDAISNIKINKNIDEESKKDEKESENFEDILEIIKNDFSKYEICDGKITLKLKVRVCDADGNKKITYVVDDPVVVIDVCLAK